MRLGHLPVDEQLIALREALGQNTSLMTVISRASRLGLNQWYLVAGAVMQTVWNVTTQRPAAYGIRDYDLIYFDSQDLSWDAENVVIQRASDLFADLDVVVEVRNEARVHLWYEERFGVPREPYTCVEDAIDSFPSMASRIGVRPVDGHWRVYAPSGLSDLFNLILRPNPALVVPAVYERKATRYLCQWPELTVLPWGGV